MLDGTSAGACVAAAQVSFVDNGGQVIQTCKNNRPTADGTTVATAFCDVQDAVVGSAKGFVVVAGHGSAFPYGTSNVGGTDVQISRTVTLIGPGANALSDPATTALLSTTSNAGQTAPCVSVADGTTAVIDGFEIGDTNKVEAVSVGNGASVTLRRNWIHNATAGVVSPNSNTSCTLTMDANDIVGNSTYGIHVTACMVTLTNNVIAGNGSSTVGAGAPGVTINNPGTGSVFAFNTVANNANGTSTVEPGGIACEKPMQISNSIVYGNTPLLNGSQLAGCTLSNVVTGTDSATGATQSPPLLDSNYRLKIAPTDTQNRACCIDKLPAPGTPYSDHDVNFTSRPKGTNATPYDIGAHEAE